MSVPSSTKYEPSKAFNNNNSTNQSATYHSNNEYINKSRSCKSYESINMLKSTPAVAVASNESKCDDKNIDPSTHNIHRLIKMATNWNSKNKKKSDNNSTTGSASAKYAVSDRSLISQTKIRKTQIFLNDENKIDSESALSRKMAEVTDKSIKVSHPSIDDAFTDAMSDKSVRVFNSNRTPQPIRILPMSLNRLTDMSKTNNNEINSKKSSITDPNDYQSKATTYWSNSNMTSEIGDHNTLNNNNNMNYSAKQSSISSYLSKGNKSISFMQLNKTNLNNSYKTSSSNQFLNRVGQGLPVQIQ